jgi:hypothetical protein
VLCDMMNLTVHTDAPQPRQTRGGAPFPPLNIHCQFI